MPKPSASKRHASPSSTAPLPEVVITPRLFLDVATVYDAPDLREILDGRARAEVGELAACAALALPTGPYPVGTWLIDEPPPEAPAWTAARLAVATSALERAAEAVTCAEELAVALARTAGDAADEALGADDDEMLMHPVDYRRQAERQALALAGALRRVDLAVAAGLMALGVDVPEDVETSDLEAFG